MFSKKEFKDDLISFGFTILNPKDIDLFLPGDISAAISHIKNLKSFIENYFNFLDNPDTGFSRKKDGWGFRFDKNTKELMYKTEAPRLQYKYCIKNRENHLCSRGSCR